MTPLTNGDTNQFYRQQNKGNNPTSQQQTIFQYFGKQVATASMAANATGIPQKNICRYKRDLEKAGLLKEVEKNVCKLTGFKAWYITTDPAKFPIPSQLNLF